MCIVYATCGQVTTDHCFWHCKSAQDAEVVQFVI